MTTISLFEHQPLSFTEGDNSFKEAHLRQLDLLNRQAGVDLVKLGYHRIQATSYVGVIQLGRVTLQILPKVDRYGYDDPHNLDSVKSAVTNLLWMLVYAGDLDIHEQEITALLKQRADLFEILVYLFCDRLMAQVERGLHRTYESREESLPVLKGRWLFSRQLREQPLRRDRFLVAYDEFVPDNPLNRVLAYTVYYLQNLSRDPANRQRLDTLRLWFDEVTLLPRITPTDLRVIFTRLNAAYRPMFDLACMFLRQEAFQLQAGATPTFNFLFDMNMLFERFVAGFLRRHRLTALPEPYQPCDIIAQARGETRWLACRPDGRPAFRLQPDLLLRSPDRQVALIIDTKYKTQPRISEADAYQMHAYATRYHCPQVLLLYPQGEMSVQTLYIDRPETETPTRLWTGVINLRRNLSQQAGREQLAAELAAALKGS
jgi:5-methylcytosine-specific restriction enzyme subunit McrC